MQSRANSKEGGTGECGGRFAKEIYKNPRFTRILIGKKRNEASAFEGGKYFADGFAPCGNDLHASLFAHFVNHCIHMGVMDGFSKNGERHAARGKPCAHKFPVADVGGDGKEGFSARADLFEVFGAFDFGNLASGVLAVFITEMDELNDEEEDVSVYLAQEVFSFLSVQIGQCGVEVSKDNRSADWEKKCEGGREGVGEFHRPRKGYSAPNTEGNKESCVFDEMPKKAHGIFFTLHASRRRSGFPKCNWS